MTGGRVFHALLRLDRWTRARFTPLGRMLLAALIGIGLFALNPRATLAYQLAVIVLAVIIASLMWAPLFRPTLRVRRNLPRYATVGTPLEYSVELVNEGAAPLDDLRLEDEPRRVPARQAMEHAVQDLTGSKGLRSLRVGYMRFMRSMRRMEGARCSSTRLAVAQPGRPVQVQMELMPLRRGYVYLDELQATRSDPLGVFRAMCRVAVTDRVLVLPQRYPVTWSAAGATVHRSRGGQTRSRNSGAGADFARLREYRPRDPLRHIHWRAWARLGEPMVKEFHEETPSRNALLFDTCAPASCTGAIFEEAVSVAASFVADPGWRKGRLDLLFTGESTVHLTQGSEGEGVGRMLEALAGISRSDGSGFARLAETVNQRIGGFGACILVLLDLDEPRIELVRALHAAQITTLVLLVAGDADERVRRSTGAIPAALRVLDVMPGQAAEVLSTLGAPRTMQAAHA